MKFLVWVTLGLMLGTGCTSVRPPVNVDHPVRVYVLYCPTHTALAIPGPDGDYTAWGFGDGLYMTSRNPVRTLWGAVIVLVGWIGPISPGALERVPLAGWERDTIEAEIGMTAHEFIVDESQVARLASELEDQFSFGTARNREDTIRETDQAYSAYWYGCGDVVADWCRQLGADVPRICAPRWGRWTVRH